MPGCRYPLVVKIADTERDKAERRRLQNNQFPNNYQNSGGGGGGIQQIGQPNIINGQQQQPPNVIQLGANGLSAVAPAPGEFS